MSCIHHQHCYNFSMKSGVTENPIFWRMLFNCCLRAERYLSSYYT